MAGLGEDGAANVDGDAAAAVVPAGAAIVDGHAAAAVAAAAVVAAGAAYIVDGHAAAAVVAAGAAIVDGDEAASAGAAPGLGIVPDAFAGTRRHVSYDGRSEDSPLFQGDWAYVTMCPTCGLEPKCNCFCLCPECHRRLNGFLRCRASGCPHGRNAGPELCAKTESFTQRPRVDESGGGAAEVAVRAVPALVIHVSRPRPHADSGGGGAADALRGVRVLLVAVFVFCIQYVWLIYYWYRTRG